jgi:hypothetical protein
MKFVSLYLKVVKRLSHRGLLDGKNPSPQNLTLATRLHSQIHLKDRQTLVTTIYIEQINMKMVGNLETSLTMSVLSFLTIDG